MTATAATPVQMLFTIAKVIQKAIIINLLIVVLVDFHVVKYVRWESNVYIKALTGCSTIRYSGVHPLSTVGTSSV